MLWRSFTHDILNWKKKVIEPLPLLTLFQPPSAYFCGLCGGHLFTDDLHSLDLHKVGYEGRVDATFSREHLCQQPRAKQDQPAGARRGIPDDAALRSRRVGPEVGLQMRSIFTTDFFLHSDLFSVVVPSVVCFASTRTLRYVEFLTLTISPYSESISVTQGDPGVFHICRPFFTIVKMHNPPLRSAPNWIYFSDTICRIVLIFLFIHILLFYF